MKKEKVKKDKAEENGFPGYPYYDEKDDIYKKEKEEIDIDPEDPKQKKPGNEDEDMVINEKNFEDDVTAGDLDIPGSETDNDMESVGNEDEENNYYSLGGDNHKNLEEDQGIKPEE